MIRIFHADCLEFLKAQPDASYDMVWADPPDNLGLSYDEYDDKLVPAEYYGWLIGRVLPEMCRVSRGVVWLSVYAKHLPTIHKWARPRYYHQRLFLWTYTFSQYRETDCANSFRPIIRFAREGWQPNVDLIREPSRRMELGDKRAAGPRVPSDVWSYPRVNGNAKERRDFHPTQHPEALMERILLMSKPLSGPYRVLDCFLGSGTTAIVSKKIGGIECDGCEMSLNYCQRAAEILGVPVL